MYQLEDRILFDAAAAVDVAEANENADANLADEVPITEGHANDGLNDSDDYSQETDGQESDSFEADKDNLLLELSAQMDNQTVKTLNVLLIDDEIENADEIAKLANENTLVIRYDASEVDGADLINLIKENTGTNKIGSIGFITETSKNGTVQVISETTTLENIENSSQSEFWSALDNLIEGDGNVNFFTSNLAKTETGTQLLDKLASEMDADVNASSDYTGGQKRNADWNLEYTESGNEIDLKEIYFKDEIAVDNLAIDTGESRELHIINGIIPDRETIINQLGEDAEYIILKGEGALEDLLKQLEGQGEYDAIHLVTNGGNGYFRMGYDIVDSDYIQENKDLFAELGDSLTEDGDILVYGCDLAASQKGESLVNFLADVTNADISASDDLTGKGGDWDLEYTVGLVETDTLSFNDYEYHLAGITVNCIKDYNVFNPDDNIISLREAVYYAAEGETIGFTYWKHMVDYNEVSNGTGMLYLIHGQIEIDKSITINGDTEFEPGKGHFRIQLNAGVNSRVFYIAGKDNQAINVELDNMHINNGTAKGTTDADGSGGGIYSGSNVSLKLDTVLFYNCSADVSGGGLFAIDNVEIVDSSTVWNTGFYMCRAQNGGGIYALGNLSITGKLHYYTVTFENNSADVSGGAIHSSKDLSIYEANFEYNTAGTGVGTGKGGAIYSNGEISRMDVVTFKNNSTNDAGGAFYITGAQKDIYFWGTDFEGNKANFGGAIAIVNSKGFEISASASKNNEAIDKGGFIYFTDNKGSLEINSKDRILDYETDELFQYKYTTSIYNAKAGSEGSIIYMANNYEDAQLIMDKVSMSTISAGSAIYASDIASASFNAIEIAGKGSSCDGVAISTNNVSTSNVVITNSTFTNLGQAIYGIDVAQKLDVIGFKGNLSVTSSTFTNTNNGVSTINFGGGSLTIEGVTFYNSSLSLTGNVDKYVVIGNTAFVSTDGSVEQQNIKQIDIEAETSVENLNVHHSMLSHYKNSTKAHKFFNTENLKEVTVGTQKGRSLIDSNNLNTTITTTKGVLDARGNLLGVDNNTSKFLSKFAFLDSVLRTQGDRMTKVHSVKYEQSLLYGYYVDGKYQRSGNSSSATDQRGANRHGYYLSKDGHLINWGSGKSSMGAFEAIFYTVVDAKGEDKPSHWDYYFHDNNYKTFDAAKSIYKRWSQYSASEQQKMFEADPQKFLDLGAGSTGMTLKEAIYWIDTFDRDASLSVDISDVNIKLGDNKSIVNTNSINGGKINLYDHNRYVHFSNDVFNENQTDNTINISGDIILSISHTENYKPESTDVMIGSAFSTAIAIDKGASFLVNPGDKNPLVYSDAMARDNTYLSQDSDKRISIVSETSRVFNIAFRQWDPTVGKFVDGPVDDKLIINNLNISGKISSSNSSGKGAGIYNNGELILNNVVLHDCVIDGVLAWDSGTVHGGALYNSSNGLAIIYDSTIENNTMDINANQAHHISYSGLGAGIYNEGDLVIENSAILNNSIIANNKQYISNSAHGAGIFHKTGSSASLAIINTTIAGNYIDLTVDQQNDSGSGYGSALHVENTGNKSGDILLVNNTITKNTIKIKAASGTSDIAEAEQAAIYIEHKTSSNKLDVTLVNNIIADNTMLVVCYANVNLANDFFILSTSDINFTESNNLVGAYYFDETNPSNLIGYNFNTANKSASIDFVNQATEYKASKGKAPIMIQGVEGGFIKNLNLAENLAYNGGRTKSYRLLDGSIAFGFGSAIAAKNVVNNFNSNNSYGHKTNGDIRSISGSDTETGKSLDQRGLFRDYDGTEWNIGSYESLTKAIVTSNSSGSFDVDKGYIYNASKYIKEGSSLGYFDENGNWVQQNMTLKDALYWIDGAGAAKLIMDFGGGNNYEIHFKADTGAIYYTKDGTEYFLYGKMNATKDKIIYEGYKSTDPGNGSVKLSHYNGKIIILDESGAHETSSPKNNFHDIMEEANMYFNIDGLTGESRVQVDTEGNFYFTDGDKVYYLYGDISTSSVGNLYFVEAKDGVGKQPSSVSVGNGSYKLVKLNTNAADTNNVGKVSTDNNTGVYLFKLYEKTSAGSSTITLIDKLGNQSNVGMNVQYEGNTVTFDEDGVTGPDIYYTDNNGVKFALFGQVYDAVQGQPEKRYVFLNAGITKVGNGSQYNFVDLDIDDATGSISTKFTYKKSVVVEFRDYVLHEEHQPINNNEAGEVKFFQPKDNSVISFDASRTIKVGTGSNVTIEKLWKTDRGGLEDRGIYFNHSITNDPAEIQFGEGGALRITKNVTIDGKIKCSDTGVNDHLVDKNVVLDAEEKSRIFIIDDLQNDNLCTTYIKNMHMRNGKAVYSKEVDGKIITKPVHGGSIFNRENLILENVSIVDSYASGNGGVLYSETGNVQISSSMFERVSAGLSGGGIYAVGGNFSMIKSNIGVAKAGTHGGAIALESITEAYIESSGFVYSEAGTYGGGMSLKSIGELKIINVTVANNIAGENGGGIFISGADDAFVTYTTIANNVAGKNAKNDKTVYYGGGLYVESGTMRIDNSIISQNAFYKRDSDSILVKDEAKSNIYTDSLTKIVTKNCIKKADAGLSEYAEKNTAGDFKVFVLSGSNAKDYDDGTGVAGQVPLNNKGVPITSRTWTTVGAYEKVEKTYVYMGKDNIGDTAVYSGHNDIFKGGKWYLKDANGNLTLVTDYTELTSSWDTTYIIDGDATVILDNGASIDTGARNALIIDDTSTATKSGTLIVNNASIKAVLTVATNGALTFNASSVYNLPKVTNKYAPGGEYYVTTTINNSGTITFGENITLPIKYSTVNAKIALNEGGRINFLTDTIKGDFSLTVNDITNTTITYDYDSTYHGQQINRYGVEKYYNLVIKGIGSKAITGDVDAKNIVVASSSGTFKFNGNIDTQYIDFTGNIFVEKNLTTNNFTLNSTTINIKGDFNAETSDLSTINNSVLNAKEIVILNNNGIALNNSSLTATSKMTIDGSGTFKFYDGQNKLESKIINFDNELKVLGENTSLDFKADSILFADKAVRVMGGAKLTFDIKDDLTLVEYGTARPDPQFNSFNLGMFTVEAAAIDGSYAESELHFNSAGKLSFGIDGDNDSNLDGAVNIKGIIGFGADNISFENEFNIVNATVAFNSEVSILNNGTYTFGKGVIFNDKVILGANGTYTIEATNRMVEFNGKVIGNNASLIIVADAAATISNASNLANLTMTSKTSKLTVKGDVKVKNNIILNADKDLVANNAKLFSENGIIEINAVNLIGDSAAFVVSRDNLNGSKINFSNVNLTGNLENSADMKVKATILLGGNFVNRGKFLVKDADFNGDWSNQGEFTASNNFIIGGANVNTKMVQTGTANINNFILDGEVRLTRGALEVQNFDFRVDKTLFAIDKGASLYVTNKITNTDVDSYFNLAKGGTLYQNVGGDRDSNTNYFVGDKNHSVLIAVDSVTSVGEKLGVRLGKVKHGKYDIKDNNKTLGFQFGFKGIERSALKGKVSIYYNSDDVGSDFANSKDVYTAYNTDGSNWKTPKFDKDGKVIEGSTKFPDKLDNSNNTSVKGYNKVISMSAGMDDVAGMTFTFAMANASFAPIITDVAPDEVYLNANQQYWINQELVDSITYRIRYNDMTYKANTKAFLKQLKKEGLTDNLGGTPESGLMQASELANDNGIIFENNSEQFFGAMDGTYATDINNYQGTPNLVGEFANGTYTNYGQEEVQGALESIMLEMAEEKDLFDTHPAVNSGPDSIISWFQRQIREDI